MMKISGNEVVVISTECVKVGCTTVTRRQALEVIKIMDAYKPYVQPKRGEVMYYDDGKGDTFSVTATGATEGVVIENNSSHHHVGKFVTGWTWDTDHASWSNLGTAE